MFGNCAVDVPVFRSLALDALPHPDFADVQLISLPPGLVERLDLDPAAVARAVFSVKAVPVVVKALFGLRQAVMPLIGVARSGRDVFAVAKVSGPEALIATDETHLNFRVGVAIENGLLRVTTVVQLHGWRGRSYFLPVRQLHGPVLRAMMRAAIRGWVRSVGAEPRRGEPGR